MLKKLLLSLLLFSGTAAAAPEICKKEPLACNIYFEARGEPIDGQYAVAFVTMNRLKSGRFGKTVKDVVYQPRQFSWTRMRLSINDPESWARAKRIASDVKSLGPKEYRRRDVTGGALYFHAKSVYLPKIFPAERRVATIGSHHFYS